MPPHPHASLHNVNLHSPALPWSLGLLGLRRLHGRIRILRKKRSCDAQNLPTRYKRTEKPLTPGPGLCILCRACRHHSRSQTNAGRTFSFAAGFRAFSFAIDFPHDMGERIREPSARAHASPEVSPVLLQCLLRASSLWLQLFDDCPTCQADHDASRACEAAPRL